MPGAAALCPGSEPDGAPWCHSVAVKKQPGHSQPDLLLHLREPGATSCSLVFVGGLLAVTFRFLCFAPFYPGTPAFFCVPGGRLRGQGRSCGTSA